MSSIDNLYQLIRPLLFKLDAERAHQLTLSLLHYVPSWCFSKSVNSEPVLAMGLKFPHRIGLAAGLDKNAEHLDDLAKLGFSFIEIGTVTPRPQIGNPKPRLFRIPKAHAIINRFGFNSFGVEVVVKNIQKAKYSGILGINIGKNKDTELNHAIDDYLYCLKQVYNYASYITINISSPNTPGLRQLQQIDYLKALIATLRDEQLHLSDLHKRYVPLVVKLSPDEIDNDLKQMAEVILAHKLDGIIATNTTCDRGGVESLPYGNEVGGISGRPLIKRSTECLRVIKSVVGEELTLIGVGGIDNPIVAGEKLEAGASLVQIYSGLIYEGPGLVKRLADQIKIAP